MSYLADVVGSAGFDTRSEGGLVQATERLPQHDGAGCGTVHIQVACLDRDHPVSLFPVVEAFEAGCQPVFGLVNQIHGFIQVSRHGDPQHWPEQLGRMGRIAEGDIPFDSRRVECGVAFVPLGHHSPRLPRSQFFQAEFQVPVWRANQWVHARCQIPRRPDGYALHHIAERQLKFRTVKDLLFKDQQRRRPAFLAARPEGRVNDVLDRLVPVSQRGDDGSVLATGLGQQVHLEFAL